MPLQDVNLLLLWCVCLAVPFLTLSVYVVGFCGVIIVDGRSHQNGVSYMLFCGCGFGVKVGRVLAANGPAAAGSFCWTVAAQGMKREEEWRGER